MESSYLKLLSGIETVKVVVPILKMPHFFKVFETDLLRHFLLLLIFGLENTLKKKFHESIFIDGETNLTFYLYLKKAYLFPKGYSKQGSKSSVIFILI